MGELRVGGRRGGGEDVVVGAGGIGDDSASESMAASLGSSGVSSGSLCSSSLTDDVAESSLAAGDPTPSSRSSPSDTMMQLDVGGGGPLYELSPLLAHLPVRRGLSKYYEGKSQSYTCLSDVKCLQDLAKKAAPHTGRTAASRSTMSQHVPGPCGKTIAKKTPPRGSSRARSRGLSHRSGKPPAYQSKEELCSRDFC